MMRLFLALAVLAAAVPGSAPAQEGPQAQFEATCAACHQLNGQGIKGAFPALAGDPFVLGDPDTVIAVVLNGRAGMPAWKGDLTDAQIAAAITYIRSAWGNAAAPVSEAQVAAARARSGATTAARGLQAH